MLTRVAVCAVGRGLQTLHARRGLKAAPYKVMRTQVNPRMGSGDGVPVQK
jgi:hypothetical protein